MVNPGSGLGAMLRMNRIFAAPSGEQPLAVQPIDRWPADPQTGRRVIDAVIEGFDPA